MVACQATFLRAYQRLIESEQHLIQFKDIVIPVHEEILNYHIEFTAVRQSKPRAGDEILRLIDVQFQCKGKSQRRRL